MAGFTLTDMRRFDESGKSQMGNKRDKLVREDNSIVYYLWGNKIAEVKKGSGELWISDASYRSQLTKDRLNQLLPSGHRIKQEKGEWYLNDKIFDGEATIKI